MTRDVGPTVGEDSVDRWLLLVYRVPSEPTRLRATVWRRLKALGAVYLQNSAAALPAGQKAEHALRRLRRDILEMNGTAILLSCSALVGERDVRGLFDAARDSEYDEILDKCQDFHVGLEKEYAAEHFTFGSWRRTRSSSTRCGTGSSRSSPVTCSVPLIRPGL